MVDRKKYDYKEYDKLYRIKNKEKLNKQAREYYAKNKEWIASKRDNEIRSAKIIDYYKKNPDKKKSAQLKYLYGITLNEFNDIIIKQGGGCVLCGSKKNLCVDHDHSKKKGDKGFVRGVLCNTCNAALGMFKDSGLRLMSAALYVSGDDLN